MKKKFPINWIINRGFLFGLVLYGALVVEATYSWASPDLDRQFKLETIGFLKSRDNLDGVFADYVSTAYRDYLSHQSRFVLNDLSKADAILSNSKISYSKVIHDNEILAQLARATRTESLIRTEITKEGSKYFVTMDWLHAPYMELIASESFEIEEPSNGAAFGVDSVSETIEAHLGALVAKLPFLGHVTGRDNNSVTINLGASSKIKKGDTLVVSTLDDVKKHPLLKAIVDWRMSPTGKIVVESIEDEMAFCRVVEEEPGREIARYQKITQIQSFTPAGPTVQQESTAEKATPDEPPRNGWVSVAVPLGSYSRQYSSTVNNINNTGGGVDLGLRAQGQVWFTRSWFSDLEFGYSYDGFGQHDANTGTQSPATQSGGISGSLFLFKIDVGYSYLITGDLFGPKGWLKMGYKSNSYSLPQSTTENTGPFSISSLFVGLGGDLPIRGNWGIEANADFRLISFLGQNWNGSSSTGSTDVEFFVGGYYRFTPRMTVRAGIDVIANGSDYTSTTSLSQKTVTFAPALLYYF